MASASAKSQALARVGRKHFVSQRALEAVLREVEQNPEVLGSSRGSIKRSRDEHVDVETPYGKLLGKLLVPVKHKKGIKNLQLPVLNLQAFLWYMCSMVPCMSAFMQQRLALHPSTADRKWRLCLYVDEISPGNPLRPLNTRKIHAYYASFVELGPEARCQERFWFCVCLARTSVVNSIVGGLSGLTHKILDSPDIKNLANGCLLTMGPTSQSEKYLFFAEMHTMVGDEAALKMVFDIKGASGTLPCGLCTNLVSRLQEHDRTGTLLPLHTTDHTLLRSVSNESAWQTQALLISREATMTKKDFGQLQQSLGVNCNPHGVLAHRSLGIKSSLMYDWMHIYLVNGLYHQEVGRLLPKLYESGHSADSILSFMESFAWPHNLTSRRNETLQCFQKKISPDEFRASASQSLNSYPLLRLFVLGLGVMDCSALIGAVKSFLKLCLVLDLLVDGNRGNPLEADTLHNAVVDHLQASLASHGELGVVPKFHYALHLGLIAREKDLISCFTHERKHREIKRKANQLHNPQHWFEEAVLKDVWGTALLELEGTATVQPHLVAPKLDPAVNTSSCTFSVK